MHQPSKRGREDDTDPVDEQDRIPEAIKLFRIIADESLRAKRDKVPLNIGHLTFDIDNVTYGTEKSMYRDLVSLSAVIHLVNNGWFRRVWVVQEAALATNLRFLCGEHEINRFVLEDAAYNTVSLGALYNTHGVPLSRAGLTQA
jgi:hypothetical protein